MNELQRPLLDKPSIGGNFCAVCGCRANNHHHVIQKGMGGLPRRVERRIPTIVLCGMGNASGCHGLAHAHKLHFRWNGHWEYLMTREPVKYADALRMQGWVAMEVKDEQVIGRR